MKLTLLSLLISVLIFSFLPEIDLKFSGLFYDNGFFLEKNLLVLLIYYSVRFFCVLTVGISLFVICHDLIKKFNIRLPLQSLSDKVRSFVKIDTRAAIFLFLVIVITPGVLVHNVMKPLWDRARPNDIQEFGGEMKFSPVYKLNHHQDGNNSFPSGHASMAAALIALGFLVSEARRKKVFIATGVYTAIASLGRVVQGGHFLSDVTISVLLTILTILMVKKWLYRA